MSDAMSAARRMTGSWLRRAPMLAGLLALALQMIFPAGFMAAEPGRAHGFPIVICSAQGQAVVDWNAPVTNDGHKQSPVQKDSGKSMAGCPFAGHSMVSQTPPPAIVATPVAFAPEAPAERGYAVFPGRGLAAPPPPSIGPPLQV